MDGGQAGLMQAESRRSRARRYWPGAGSFAGTITSDLRAFPRASLLPLRPSRAPLWVSAQAPAPLPAARERRQAVPARRAVLQPPAGAARGATLPAVATEPEVASPRLVLALEAAPAATLPAVVTEPEVASPRLAPALEAAPAATLPAAATAPQEAWRRPEEEARAATLREAVTGPPGACSRPAAEAALHVATRPVPVRVQEAARQREAAAAPGASPSPWAAAEVLALRAVAAKEALDPRRAEPGAEPGAKPAECPLSVPDQGKAASSVPAMGLLEVAWSGQPLPTLAAAFPEGRQQAGPWRGRHRSP